MIKNIHPNSCINCRYLRTENESEMGYTYYSYDYCDKVERYMHLKSFPFKKEMPCFEIDFWAAIVLDGEIKVAYDLDMENEEYTANASYKLFIDKYYPTINPPPVG